MITCCHKWVFDTFKQHSIVVELDITGLTMFYFFSLLYRSSKGVHNALMTQANTQNWNRWSQLGYHLRTYSKILFVFWMSWTWRYYNCIRIHFRYTFNGNLIIPFYYRICT